MKNVLRYKYLATLEGQIEYDPAVPATYTRALEFAAQKRKILEDMGATVEGTPKPARVRE